MSRHEDSDLVTRPAAGLNRREFLAAVAAAQGAFVLGFWMPQKVDAQKADLRAVPGAVWYEDPATPEINAWIVIAPDDTVTIRIASATPENSGRSSFRTNKTNS